MILEFLKNEIGYYLIHLQQTVTHWVKTRIDKLVEEKIKLGIKIEKNDFKAMVKQFAKHMETVAQNINDLVKSYHQKVVENLEAARLENMSIFQINDKPISRTDTPNSSTNYSNTLGLSIALNS